MPSTTAPPLPPSPLKSKRPDLTKDVHGPGEIERLADMRAGEKDESGRTYSRAKRKAADTQRREYYKGYRTPGMKRGRRSR